MLNNRSCRVRSRSCVLGTIATNMHPGPAVSTSSSVKNTSRTPFRLMMQSSASFVLLHRATRSLSFLAFLSGREALCILPRHSLIRKAVSRCTGARSNRRTWSVLCSVTEGALPSSTSYTSPESVESEVYAVGSTRSHSSSSTLIRRAKKFMSLLGRRSSSLKRARVYGQQPTKVRQLDGVTTADASRR